MVKNYDMEDTPYFFRCYKEKIWILFYQQYLPLIIMIFLIKENSNLLFVSNSETKEDIILIVILKKKIMI